MVEAGHVDTHYLGVMHRSLPNNYNIKVPNITNTSVTPSPAPDIGNSFDAALEDFVGLGGPGGLGVLVGLPLPGGWASVPFQQYLVKQVAHTPLLCIPVLFLARSTTAQARHAGNSGSCN
jgi:hypothetical protein